MDAKIQEVATKLFKDNKNLKEIWICSNSVAYNKESDAIQFQKIINPLLAPEFVTKEDLKTK